MNTAPKKTGIHTHTELTFVKKDAREGVKAHWKAILWGTAIDSSGETVKAIYEIYTAPSRNAVISDITRKGWPLP